MLLLSKDIHGLEALVQALRQYVCIPHPTGVKLRGRGSISARLRCGRVARHSWDRGKVSAVPLSAADIRIAFDALSKELATSDCGEQAEFVVVGGAALVLLYGARQTTKDVDGAKAYLVTVTEGPVLYESPALLVKAPSIAQLLAMKLAAWRDDIDRSDARLLLSELSGSLEEVRALIDPLVLPYQRDKALYALEDLWEAIHGAT